MEITLQLGFWELMVNTWFVMAVLVIGSWLVTRRMRRDPPLSSWQHAIELTVETIQRQIAEVAGGDSRPYVPFVGTVFLFIAAAVLLSILPAFDGWFGEGTFKFYHPPTAYLETTIALALCVFFAVPLFAIRKRGWRHWLGTYIQPSPFMLPFNIIGDITRTVALAVRLFGNTMSGMVIGAILLVIAPFFFPVLMQVLSLSLGVIQAYIFAILAMVYIASAVQVEEQRQGHRLIRDRPAQQGTDREQEQRG